MSKRALGRQFRAGDVFTRILPPIPAGVGRPGLTQMNGEKDVRISTLAATQKKLHPERVKHYADNPDHDPITVLHTRQAGNLIFDGHHRAAAAKLRGEKTIRATVRGWE